MSLEAMLNAMRADLARYRRDPHGDAGLLKTVYSAYGLQASLVYRFGRELQNQSRSTLIGLLMAPLWLLYFALERLIRLFYGIELAITANIGPGLYIGHFGGVRVQHCTIGKCCSIAQHTTIGKADAKPQIGARVWIGAHSSITHAVTIGDTATIAAGCTVVNDVASGALVMGSPARVVNRNYDNRSLLGA